MILCSPLPEDTRSLHLELDNQLLMELGTVPVQVG